MTLEQTEVVKRCFDGRPLVVGTRDEPLISHSIRRTPRSEPVALLAVRNPARLGYEAVTLLHPRLNDPVGSKLIAHTDTLVERCRLRPMPFLSSSAPPAILSSATPVLRRRPSPR